MMSLTGSVHELTVLVGFFLALLLLDSYDVVLPQGEGVSISGPLVGALIVLEQSPIAVVLAVLASVLVRLSRGLLRSDWSRAMDIPIEIAAGTITYFLGQYLAASVMAPAALVLVPACYLLTEFSLRQARAAFSSHRPFLRLLVGNVSRQALLLAAQLSVAALTVVTQETMGVWSLVPVVALLLLMRQTYAMLIELNETYLATMAILVESAESQRPELAGHSDRTANVARAIGIKCALSAKEIERVEYAALLHDIDRISASSDEPPLAARSGDVIRDVEFLKDVVPLLDLIDGEAVAQMNDRDLAGAFIVALASDIDANEHPSVSSTAVARLSSAMPGRIKATVVSAALELGYPVPAID